MKYGGVGAELSVEDDYIVVMQHPVTNEYEESRKHIAETLEAIGRLGVPTFGFGPMWMLDQTVLVKEFVPIEKKTKSMSTISSRIWSRPISYVSWPTLNV